MIETSLNNSCERVAHSTEPICHEIFPGKLGFLLVSALRLLSMLFEEHGKA